MSDVAFLLTAGILVALRVVRDALHRANLRLQALLDEDPLGEHCDTAPDVVDGRASYTREALADARMRRGLSTVDGDTVVALDRLLRGAS